MPGVDPRSLVPHCLDCSTPVRPTTPGVWAEVVAFVEYRGSTGGSNAAALRTPTGRYLCASCCKLRRLGIPPDQATLDLGGPPDG